MGNKSTIEENSSLLPNELQDFSNITNFSDEALIKLHNHYKRISSLQTDDGVIDYAEFSEIISRDNNMTKKIFNAIDINKDGVINFREFIKYLSVFTNGSEEDKINLSFKLFSDHKTKLIYENDMILMLIDIVSVDKSKFIKTFFGKDEITYIVQNTFKMIDQQYNNTNNNSKIDIKESINKTSDIIHNSNQNSNNNVDNKNNLINKEISIDFKGYKAFIKSNPFILNWLKVDVNDIEKPMNNPLKKQKSLKKDCYHC